MASQRDRMLAGELYDAGDPELVAARHRARELCTGLNASLQLGAPGHRELLQRLLARGGDSALVQPPFFCDYGFNIELGERVYFNFNCVVLDVCRVRIGDRTLFGPAVQVCTPLHPMDAIERRTLEYGRPVAIGSDVWIGAGALILPGVRIGDRAVIGAGSVVSSDIPDGKLAVGNPCRVVRPAG